jgi:hypothetical protein
MADSDWSDLFAPIDAAAAPPAAPSPASPPALSPTGPTAAGVFDRAASFTASMAKFAAGGFRTVSHQTYQARFGYCLPCPHYDLGLCKLCGCYLDAKVKMPHEACPEGKWSAEE